MRVEPKYDRACLECDWQGDENETEEVYPDTSFLPDDHHFPQGPMLTCPECGGETEMQFAEPVERFIERMEEVDYITESKVESALALLDAQDAAQEAIDASCGWEAASRAYRDAQAARKPLRDRLDAAQRSIRGKLLAWMLKDGGEHSRLSTRKISPNVEIEDPGLVPDDYKILVIDEAKIKRIAEALGPDTSIPGVKVTTRYSVVIKKEE